MSLDLYQNETLDRLSQFEPSTTPDPAFFDGMGSELSTAAQRGPAKLGEVANIVQALPAITKDIFTGGTKAQDDYFASRDFRERDFKWKKLVGELTPNPQDTGTAAKIVGGFLESLPMIILNPPLGIAASQLSSTHELLKEDVPAAQAVGAGVIGGAATAAGFKLPILGSSWAARMGIGAAGNTVLGGVSRFMTGTVLAGTPAAEQYKTMDPTSAAVDFISGLAYGGIESLSPQARAQGGERLQALAGWARNLKPSDLAAMATLKDATHMEDGASNGRPLDPNDVDAHINRLKTAVGQVQRDEPVNVQSEPPAKLTPDPAQAHEAASTLHDMVDSAETVRQQEGIAEPTLPDDLRGADHQRATYESLQRLPREEQAAGVGQVIEQRLRDAGVPDAEARANGAIWEHLAQNFADKYNIDPADVLTRHNLDVSRGADRISGALEQPGKGIPDRTMPIPPEAAVPHSSMFNAAKLQEHPDYEAAKAGNTEAAVRLVRDLVSKKSLDDAAAKYGPGTIYLPVHAQEASGKNKIPVAIAAAYAANTPGGRVGSDIVQANRTLHTGASAMQRMVSRATFDGPVEAGARYVLVDDVTTLGGTMAELSHHIQAGGGQVAGVISLANSSRSSTLASHPDLTRAIESKYGQTIKDTFGIHPAALTAPEARYINGFRDAASLRDRAAAARSENEQRRRDAGLPGDQPAGLNPDRLYQSNQDQAFKAWFGHSKVVDAAGKPLVVYHSGSFDAAQDGVPFMGDRGFHFGSKGAAIERVTGKLVDDFIADAKVDQDETGRWHWTSSGEDSYDTNEQGFSTKEAALKDVNTRAQERAEQDTQDDASTTITAAYLSITNPKRVQDQHDDWAQAIAKAKAEGYNGLVYRNEVEDKGKDSYVAFYPTQIKSAADNIGTFDRNDPNILHQSDANTWYYSELGRQVDAVNMKAAPVQGWQDWIKGLGNKGVKADEIKWSGLSEWLDLQKGRVTKEDVHAYLRQGGVRVTEKMLGEVSNERGPHDPEIDSAIETLSQQGYNISEDPGRPGHWGVMDDDGTIYRSEEDLHELLPQNVPRDTEADLHSVLAYLNGTPKADRTSTRFGEWQLPGGENYRELLLTLPEKPQTVIRNSIESMKAEGWKAEVDYNRYTHQTAYTIRDADGDMVSQRSGAPGELTPDQALAAYADQQASVHRRDADKAVTFQSAHYEEANVLAHIRFNDRTDVQGKKVLFLEELQSDWAQQGRKKGFAGDNSARATEIRKRLDEIQTRFDELPNLGERADLDTEQRALVHELATIEARDVRGSGIPAAPFVGKTDAWLALSLKRMIRYAAENGYDRVAWTNGEQQVSRYRNALQKAVDAIEWGKTPDGVHIVGYKGGAPKVPSLDEMMRETGTGLYRAPEGAPAQWAVRWRDASESFYHTEDSATLAIENEYRSSHNLEKTQRQKVVDTTEKQDMLSDAIGKAMADKIRDDPNQKGTIEGSDITVSDTGMAGFYDRIVPKVANEVLKKLDGGKVGEAHIQGAEGKEIHIRIGGEDTISMVNGGTLSEAQVQAIGMLEGAESGEMQTIDEAIAEAKARLNDPENADITAFSRDVVSALEDFKKKGVVVEGLTQKLTQPSFDITPAMREKAMAGQPLFQEARGQIHFGDQQTVINLFENANASTFAHETGHYFLQFLKNLAERPNAPVRAMEDWAAIAKEYGIKGEGITREQHEEFARTWEAYLRNGEAPSPELKSVFQQFRDWLIDIYHSLADLRVKLTPERQALMDMLLTSQKRDPAPPPARPAATTGTLPPAAATGVRSLTPPPVGAGGEQPAATVPKPPWKPLTIEAPEMRAMLDDMAKKEAGWETVGGKWQGNKPAGEPDFSPWIPRADWWTGRPDKLNEAKVREAVAKALAGEPLKKAQQRTVDYLMEVANKRMGESTQIHPDERPMLAQDLIDNGMPVTHENMESQDLVARASQIDEGAVEAAATKHENDDAGFMAEMQRIVDDADHAQAAPQDSTGNVGQTPGPTGPSAEAAAEPGAGNEAQSVLAGEADRYAADHPDQIIDVVAGIGEKPVTMSVKDYLQGARDTAALARSDIKLLHVAAGCLMGKT